MEAAERYLQHVEHVRERKRSTVQDYRIIVRSVGRGWRATIYAPGSNTALRESPASLEECRKEAIVAEAKWIVDVAHC